MRFIRSHISLMTETGFIKESFEITIGFSKSELHQFRLPHERGKGIFNFMRNTPSHICSNSALLVIQQFSCQGQVRQRRAGVSGEGLQQLVILHAERRTGKFRAKSNTAVTASI